VTAAFVQSVSAGAVHDVDLVLPVPSTPGNMLICYGVSRSGSLDSSSNSSYLLLSHGWTAPYPSTTGSIDGAARIFWKVSTGEQTVKASGDGDHTHYVLAEFSGVGEPDITDLASGSGTAAATGAMASASTRQLYFGGIATHSPLVMSGGGAINPNASITELVDTSAGGFFPTIWAGYRIVTSPTGSYTVGGTIDGGAWVAMGLAFPGPPPPDPDPGPVVIISDPDDVELATLTEAFDVSIRVEHNNTGTGRFSINRNSAEATAAVLTPGNYVRVKVPQIDPDAVFGFFLEAGDFKLVSSDEEGGEVVTFEGRGGLAYWDRAIWLNESFLVQWWPAYIETAHGPPPAGTLGAVALAPGNYRRYSVSGRTITGHTDFTTALGFSSYYDSRRRYTNASGYTVTLVHLTTGAVSGWYVKPYGAGVTEYVKKSQYRYGPSIAMDLISTNQTPGEVVYTMYQEATDADRPEHPIPLMTIDFTDTLDSDGNPWTMIEAVTGLSAELGEDFLSTLGKLVNLGVVDVRMGPDLDMHAYNSYGRDLHGSVLGSGVVRFAKGLNIADELVREYTDSPVGTFAEVLGNTDGVIARAFLISSPPRPPREISVRGDTDDIDALEALGGAELTNRLLHSDAIGFAVATPIIGQEDPDNGLYLPGPPGSARGDYWVGDLVTLHTGSGEHDFDETTVRIAAITMTFSDANDLRVVVEVNSGFGGYQDNGGTGGHSTSTTGSTQTLSDLYQLVSERDQPFGYPTLDEDGAIASSEIPDIYETTTNGGGDVIKAHGAMGATETFDPADGNVHTGTLSANCTVTIAEPVGSDDASLVGWFTQDGTGGWTLAIDCAAGGTFTWDGGTPTLPTAAGTVFRIVFERVPATTNDWVGIPVGSGGSGSALTIKDEGSSLATAATSIDFVGAGVVASGTGAAKTVTIPGGATASDTGIWRPVMDGAGNVVTDGATGEAVMAFS
jgi:hypothetical protein